MATAHGQFDGGNEKIEPAAPFVLAREQPFA